MSEGYLQRLFARKTQGQPVLPGVTPAGASNSPVALADQRLNEPAFADNFALGAYGIMGAPSGIPEAGNITAPFAAPQPLLRTDPVITSRSTPARPLPTTLVGGDVEQAADTETPSVAPPAVAEPALFTTPIVGEVLVDDFVHRQDVDSFPPPESGTALQSSQPYTGEPSPASDRLPVASEPASAEGAEQDTPPAQIEVRTVALSRVEEVWRRRSETETALETPLHSAPQAMIVTSDAAAAAPSSETIQEPGQVIEVTPPPIMPDPLPPPMTPAPPTTPLPESATVDPATITETVSPAPSPTQPRQTRPMTAADASIIGPLSRRPRAVTLFGLRRR